MDLSNLDSKEIKSHVAKQIVEVAKSKILYDMRYLDIAIMKLNNVKEFDSMCDIDGKALFGTLMTNGNDIFYTADFIIDRFKEGTITQSARDYLHVLLHCMLKHMFVSGVNPEIWNIACDIAVENIIFDMNLPGFYTHRTGVINSELQSIRRNVAVMNAESIYQYLISKQNNRVLITKLSQLFKVDDHLPWWVRAYKLKVVGVSAVAITDKEDSKNKEDGSGEDSEDNQGQSQQQSQGKGKNKNKQQQNQQQSQNDGSNDETDDGQGQDQSDEQNNGEGQDQKQESGSGMSIVTGKAAEDLEEFLGASFIDGNEQEWSNISKRIQTDIETFSKDKLQGTGAGAFIQNLQRVNRERYDYTAFLKKFSSLQEVMKVSQDEFDYIFYTYGLKLYDKMPLIEPLEYKEEKVIRDFVIAIDTSGSVQGEIVQAFLTKTYNILKSSESFNKKVNIHIIQCDAKVQSDTVVTNLQELEQLFSKLKLKGFGGTDFRPVFDYVEKLKKDGEFTKLKGLIYFTDGYGTFPNQKPDYDTAFVFVDKDDYRNVEVPSWAIKILLESQEIKDMK